MKDIIIDFATQKIINGKIEAVQGDNTTRKVKILLKENSNPYNLTGKTVMLTMRKNSSNSYVNKGDFINLNITNAVGGEVELPINKAFTKEKGGYQLQLSVMNQADFEENTMLFEAVIHTNLREDVSGTLVESVIFQEIKQTLQEVKDIAKNEEQRKANEQQRSKNETAREEFFNTQTKPATEKVSGFTGQVAKNTKNIERAFEVLNENSFVPYSGEDVKIEHSKVGITKDMKIFGKTRYKRPNGTYTDIWEEGCALESCGETEGNKINILSTGKNLFESVEKNGSKWWISADGVVKDSSTNYSILVKIKEGKRYTVSGEGTDRGSYAYLDENFNTIQFDTGGILTTKEVAPTNSVYLLYYISSTGIKNIKNIQIEEGTQKTHYESYKEYKKEIQSQQPFAGLTNVQDTIEETDKGVEYTQNINKIVLNGAEDWSLNADWSTSDYLFCYTRINNIKNIGIAECIADKLKHVDLADKTNEGFWKESDSNFLYIRLKVASLEEFKAELQANPITVYYQLAEPIKTILSEIASLNMNTYNNITYINTLNAIKPTLSFKAPVNTPMLIGDLREKNSMLLVKNEELQNKNVELEKVNQRQTVEIIELNDTTNFLIEDALSRKLNN